MGFRTLPVPGAPVVWSDARMYLKQVKDNIKHNRFYVARWIRLEVLFWFHNKGENNWTVYSQLLLNKQTLWQYFTTPLEVDLVSFKVLNLNDRLCFFVCWGNVQYLIIFIHQIYFIQDETLYYVRAIGACPVKCFGGETNK